MSSPGKLLLVCGTSSGAGKTTVALALCRFLSTKGYKVAPFKPINLSLNSVAIPPGREISRSVWLQAAGCRIKPTSEMNPYLLKPEGRRGCQLIELGRSRGICSYAGVADYMKRRGHRIIFESASRLLEEYDVVVAEGAGSPAEINFSGEDYANTFISSRLKAPILLVGDIERGGVFASLYGTFRLMKDSSLVRWMVINRMRGGGDILKPGMRKLEQLTGVRVIGVLPYLGSISLPGEDGMDYSGSKLWNSDIAIVRYPFMENYSDIDPLFAYGIGGAFADTPGIIRNARLVILPGSKNVFEDMKYIRRKGLAKEIKEAALDGKQVLGICGGYQMLGREILKRTGDERLSVEGLGLLDARTVYSTKKRVTEVSYSFMDKKRFGAGEHTGYEIHYGRTYTREQCMLVANERREGAVSASGKIMGTNVHGLLENFHFLNGLMPELRLSTDYSAVLEKGIEMVGDAFSSHINISSILDYLDQGTVK